MSLNKLAWIWSQTRNESMNEESFCHSHFSEVKIHFKISMGQKTAKILKTHVMIYFNTGKKCMWHFKPVTIQNSTEQQKSEKCNHWSSEYTEQTSEWILIAHVQAKRYFKGSKIISHEWILIPFQSWRNIEYLLFLYFLLWRKKSRSVKRQAIFLPAGGL